jgi:hypothetical protein
MWLHGKVAVPVVTTLVILGCSVAYAQSFAETGVHTSPTGIRHGCPADPGCVGEDDDYREAYSRTVTDEPMSYAILDVLRADDRASVASVECVSTEEEICLRLDLWYATGGEAECKFLTAHYVRDRLVEDPPMSVSGGPC